MKKFTSKKLVPYVPNITNPPSQLLGKFTHVVISTTNSPAPNNESATRCIGLPVKPEDWQLHAFWLWRRKAEKAEEAARGMRPMAGLTREEAMPWIRRRRKAGGKVRMERERRTWAGDLERMVKMRIGEAILRVPRLGDFEERWLWSFGIEFMDD